MAVKVKIDNAIIQRLKNGEELELNINGDVYWTLQAYLLNQGYQLLTPSPGIKKTVKAYKIENNT